MEENNIIILIGTEKIFEKNLTFIHDKNSQKTRNSGKLTQFDKDTYKIKNIYKKPWS